MVMAVAMGAAACDTEYSATPPVPDGNLESSFEPVGVPEGTVFASASDAETTTSTEEFGTIRQSLSPDEPINMVAVAFRTGSDDKRGDSRVWLTVRLHNGYENTVEVFRSQRLPDWTYSDYIYLRLPSGTKNGDVKEVHVSWKQGGGGFNGDNWNLQQLIIWSQLSNGTWNNNNNPWGNPLRRFTGRAKTYTSTWIP